MGKTKARIVNENDRVVVVFEENSGALADLDCNTLESIRGVDTIVLRFPDRLVYVGRDEVEKLLRIKKCG